jgi:hypothetical protein
VRWVLQAASPGTDDWRNQEDRVYSGWFYGGVNDEPGETVLADYEKAVKELTWLDVRLIQETRSFTTKVLQEMKRGKEQDE